MRNTAASSALTVALAAAAIAAAIAAAGRAATPEQVVDMTAKRFEYDPDEVTLVRGVPVVLRLTGLDRQHGFKIPALGLRADVLPGETTELRFTPERTGRFVFACDYFCGADHEDMNGVIVVKDP